MTTNKLPPALDAMAPKVSQHCALCGHPAREGEGIWMIQHPEWAHESCIDWTRREFPYKWKLKHLRSIARALLRATRQVYSAGNFLSESLRTWPTDANEKLAKIKEHDSQVSEELRKVRDKMEGR